MDHKENFHSGESRGKEYSFQEKEWSKEEEHKEQ